MKNVGNSSRGRSQGVMNIFRAPYRAHCAVIFATAQLSCCAMLLVSVHCAHGSKSVIYRDPQKRCKLSF